MQTALILAEYVNDCSYKKVKEVKPMQEMKVTLKGLTCANCAGKIEKVLSEIEKTEEVSINLIRQ